MRVEVKKLIFDYVYLYLNVSFNLILGNKLPESIY